jgi:hypothetical protein
MNILLQDRRTLKYIDPMAGWTDKRNEARSFRQGLDALFFCYNTDFRIWPCCSILPTRGTTSAFRSPITGATNMRLVTFQHPKES